MKSSERGRKNSIDCCIIIFMEDIYYAHLYINFNMDSYVVLIVTIVALFHRLIVGLTLLLIT